MTTNIVDSNDSKFMESNVTPAIKKVIKELCHRLYASTNKPVTYIEIGIWRGGTFKEILRDCSDIEIHGIGIDYFEDFEALNKSFNTHVDDVITIKSAFDQYTAEGFKHFTLLKGDSVDMLNSLEKMENVVCLIDGNHTYNAVKADFMALVNKTKNGYAILDDCYTWENQNVGDNGYGIYRFFNEIKNSYKIVYQDIRNVVFKIENP